MNFYDSSIAMICLSKDGLGEFCNSEFVRIFALENIDNIDFSDRIIFLNENKQNNSPQNIHDAFQQVSLVNKGLFFNASLKHRYHYNITFQLHIIQSSTNPDSFELRFFKIVNKGVDLITELPNGWAITNQYSHDIEHIGKDNINLTYIILAVDNFSSINFHYGYQTGDDYLCEVGAILQNILKNDGFVVRYHNARFGILIRDTSDKTTAQFQENAHRIINEIWQRLNQPIKTNEHGDILKPFSIGVALNCCEYISFFDMDAATERAYFMAKSKGESAIEFARLEYAKERILQKAITDLLPKAIDNLAIDIHFQPQHALYDQKLIGFEVLARWYIKDTGFISPLDFVSTAERLGLNLELDICILTKTCRQIDFWKKEGLDVPKIAVNMSAKTLESKVLVEKIIPIVDKAMCSAHQLEFEITETDKITDSLSVVKNLTLLTALGFSFSMDDFGTGYSSLSLLRTFDFALDKLKLDIALTEKVCKEQKDKTFIKQIIELGRTLNIKILAEGIEEKEQLEALTEMGCDYGQGYYFNKPLPAKEAMALMSKIK